MTYIRVILGLPTELKKDKKKINEFKKSLNKPFVMKDLDDVKKIIGIKIIKDYYKRMLLTRRLIKKILEKFNVHHKLAKKFKVLINE